MLPTPLLVSFLFAYYQPTVEKGVSILYVDFQKRTCSQNKIYQKCDS